MILYITVGLVGSIMLPALIGLLTKEVEGWLAILPFGLLRLAKALLPRSHRIIYDEWSAELHALLTEYNDRPLTRLFRGVMYALGLIWAARTIACELGNTRERTAKDNASGYDIQEIMRSLEELATIAKESPSALDLAKLIARLNDRLSLVTGGNFEDNMDEAIEVRDHMIAATQSLAQCLPRPSPKMGWPGGEVHLVNEQSDELIVVVTTGHHRQGWLGGARPGRGRQRGGGVWRGFLTGLKRRGPGSSAAV